MTDTAPPVLICPICGNAVIMNGVGVGGQLLHWECTKSRHGLPVSIAPVGWRCPSCSTIHAPNVKACHCNTCASPVVRL